MKQSEEVFELITVFTGGSEGKGYQNFICTKAVNYELSLEMMHLAPSSSLGS